MIGLLDWGVSTIAKLTCTYTILTVKISERGEPELAQHHYHYQFHLSDLVRLYINNLPRYLTVPFPPSVTAPQHASSLYRSCPPTDPHRRRHVDRQAASLHISIRGRCSGWCLGDSSHVPTGRGQDESVGTGYGPKLHEYV